MLLPLELGRSISRGLANCRHQAFPMMDSHVYSVASEAVA